MPLPSSLPFMDLPISASFQRVYTLKGTISLPNCSIYTLNFQLVSWLFNKFIVFLWIKFPSIQSDSKAIHPACPCEITVCFRCEPRIHQHFQPTTHVPLSDQSPNKSKTLLQSIKPYPSFFYLLKILFLSQTQINFCFFSKNIEHLFVSYYNGYAHTISFQK